MRVVPVEPCFDAGKSRLEARKSHLGCRCSRSRVSCRSSPSSLIYEYHGINYPADPSLSCLPAQIVATSSDENTGNGTLYLLKNGRPTVHEFEACPLSLRIFL